MRRAPQLGQKAIAHRHRGSLRHNLDNATAASKILLDELFRPGMMPDWALAYRTRYESQRCLSLFRTCYLAGESASARHRPESPRRRS